MASTREQIGNRLAIERKVKGLKQAEVGQLLGCHFNKISIIERGIRTLDAVELSALADAGFDVDYIINGV